MPENHLESNRKLGLQKLKLGSGLGGHSLGCLQIGEAPQSCPDVPLSPSGGTPKGAQTQPPSEAWLPSSPQAEKPPQCGAALILRVRVAFAWGVTVGGGRSG